MDFNFNHFTITDNDAAKALQHYIARSTRSAFIERTIVTGLFYICGKLIVARHREIVKLKIEAENFKKGD